MTLINRYPRTLSFAIIFFALLILPSQSSVLAKRRHADPPRRQTARADNGKKLSARERRAAERQERMSARDNRRGAKSKLSKRELRRERNLSAREQAANL